MEIRRAKVGEGNLLSEIAMRSKAFWDYDMSFIAKCKDALTVLDITIADDYVYVMENKQKICGFFCLIVTGEKRELDSLFLEPAYIGKGYGRVLWHYMLNLTKEIGIKDFTIEADPYAEGFYTKMGAIRIGEVVSTVLVNRKLPLLKMIVP
ncbi:MAG: GNAT family N-acetyltransferase [Firmicutes bacterium]|nr:GNAT family N-acetyltransferase [Bacillota bacterium]